MTSLNLTLFVRNHIITKIVKAHLVVCTVSNIGIVSLLTLCVALFMNDKTYAQAEETVNFTHPFGVTLCKIVVNCYDMYALTRKCVKVSRKCSNKSLTFTGLHFGNSALVKNNTADKLYIKVTHTENTGTCLTANSECVRKNIVKCFSVCKSFFKNRSLCCKLLIIHALVFIFQIIDFVNYLAEFFNLVL